MQEKEKSRDNHCWVPIITGDSVRIPKRKVRTYVERFSNVYRGQHDADPTQKHVDLAGWILQGKLEDEFVAYAIEHDGKSPSWGVQAGRICDVAAAVALEFLTYNDANELMTDFDEHLAKCGN